MAEKPGQPEQSMAGGGARTRLQSVLDEVWTPSGGEATAGPERLLLDNGIITQAQYQQALRRQEEDRRLSITDALVKIGAIDETQALQAIAEHAKLPFRRLNASEVVDEAFEVLPEDYMRNKNVLPIGWEDDAVLMAVHDPTDIFLVDDFRTRIKQPVKLVVVPPTDIKRAIEELSAGPTQQVDEIVRDFDDEAVEVVDEEETEQQDLEQMAGESPVIRYVNYLISSAVREGASDIHIEPGEKRIRVRFRMDGILFEQSAPPIQMHAAIISRLKIMANLDIAERRLPQDGRIRASVHRRSIDLRVSTLPTVHGEKCVIRILDNRAISVGLENLGFQPDTLRTFKHEILQPHGVILVTGPTGSGKSTTLYSALQIMDHDKMNISTVEDPVEYELAAVNQVNVRSGIGMTFAAALRSLLRQDPDVVMVGEIRDAETARIAVQASLTGHLVLSTLHTNDAPSSITRLINIGIEAYLISAAVNAVLAQRLVRRICPDCKTVVDEPTAPEAEFLKVCEKEDVQLYRGAGCEKCRNTGYKGRVGLYELLVLNDDIRDIVTRNPTLTELRSHARDTGMVTLREDGLAKASQGQTTVEEVMRVTEA
ncbi:MAG: Flp pilus assembly complex ATPase component TadA [Phycisphaerae bacterium]|nr:Flp pilus assembly complex ATPase component TadA [Phycisphaerae bacterium]